MIKQYFKQAWTMVKQNKLYSTIYILGTALGITMAMIVAIYFYTKVGDVYPEYDRDLVYTVQQLTITPKDTTDHMNSNSFLSAQTVEECFYPLQTPEAVTAISIGDMFSSFSVSQIGSNVSHSVYCKYVDTAFWKVFDFDFKDGAPFTEADFKSGLRKAVLTDNTAKTLFPDGASVGKKFVFNEEEYTVVGVVREPSFLAKSAFANIYVPYTSLSTYRDTWNEGGILGMMTVMMKLKHKSDAPKLRVELEQLVKKYQDGLDFNIDLMGQPDDTLTASFRLGNRPVDLGKIIKVFLAIVLLFLIIPAINLSGLNSSSMDKRLAEIGIRKTFGAPRSVLLRQVLVENMLLTLIGALVGLLFSSLIAYFFSEYLMDMMLKMLSSEMGFGSNSRGLTWEIVINIPVFLAALLVAMVINVLSAFIPAYRYTRRNIIDALFNNTMK